MEIWRQSQNLLDFSKTKVFLIKVCTEDLKNLIQFTDKVKSQFTPEGLREETSVLLDIVANPQKLTQTKDKIQSLPL